MRMKGFEERHSIDQGNEEHLDIQDCEIPRDKEKKNVYISLNVCCVY